MFLEVWFLVFCCLALECDRHVWIMNQINFFSGYIRGRIE